MRIPRGAVLGSSWLVLTVSGACDSERPALPTSVGQSPGAVVTAIEILGAEDVPPGQSIHLVASATYSDGTTRNVTGEATWSAATVACGSCPKPTDQALSLSGPGIIAASQRGEGLVTARVGSQQAMCQIMVVPPGTYRLTGVVTFIDFPNAPIPDSLGRRQDAAIRRRSRRRRRNLRDLRSWRRRLTSNKAGRR